MASNITQQNVSFKKLVGRGHTSINKQWYEEKPGRLAYIHKTNIWMDDIPSTPPVSDTPSIKVYNNFILTQDFTVVNNQSWVAKSGTIQLSGCIPPIFGQGYNVRVFDNLNREISSSDPSGWWFDYDNANLVFENNPINYGWQLPIKINFYLYIGALLTGNGGGVDPEPSLNGIIQKSCDLDVVVNDLVYISHLENIAKKNINNSVQYPTIGIVVEKPTMDTCKILVTGFCNYTTNILSPGMNVFLGENGLATTVKPTSGFLQVIGVAYDTNKIYISPNLNRVKLF